MDFLVRRGIGIDANECACTFREGVSGLLEVFLEGFLEVFLCRGVYEAAFFLYFLETFPCGFRHMVSEGFKEVTFLCGFLGDVLSEFCFGFHEVFMVERPSDSFFGGFLTQ